MELMKKVYDKHGVLSFPGSTGVQMGDGFKKKSIL